LTDAVTVVPETGRRGWRNSLQLHGRFGYPSLNMYRALSPCIRQLPLPAKASATAIRSALLSLVTAVLGVAATSTAVAQVPAPARVWMPFSHLGTGVTVGTTGVGAEVAVPYGAYWNIRAGVSYLGYSRTFQTSASPVEGQLRLGGARLGVDWFPLAGGFHVSLGVMVPNLTRATAHLNLQPGETLTIEGTDYTTDSTNPFRGSGHSEIYRAAPVLTVGWGNLIPRNYHRRFSFPIEVGAAYEGPPTAHIMTSGDICAAGQACSSAVSNSGFNQNLNEAIRDLNGNLDRYARFFPIISVGVGYRF
jgi:hypothetical protein